MSGRLGIAAIFGGRIAALWGSARFQLVRSHLIIMLPIEP
jgi:hypothetical protein